MVIRVLKHERFHTPIRWAMEDSGLEHEIRVAVSNRILYLGMTHYRILHYELTKFCG